MKLSKLLVSLSFPLLLTVFLVALTFPHHASAQAPVCPSGPILLDVTQNISNDVDSGFHGYWAFDNYSRHIRVWLDADGTTFCAQVDYNGTFHAPAGVLSPQGGSPISDDINGTFTGGYSASIANTTMKDSPNIPTTVDYQGNIATGEIPGYVSWIAATFNSGAGFHYLNNDTDWSWTYTTPHNGTWINAGITPGSPGDIGPIVLTTGETAPDNSGNATVTDANKDVVITSTSTPITVEAGSIANATLDLGSLISSGTGSIPETTINSDVVDVEIPATTITSTDTSWDGTINLPKVITTTVQPIADSGNTATVVSSIEVGFGDTHLTFDAPVKLTFPNGAGSSIGWSQNGTFHAITAICDFPTNPTLDADSECKIDAAPDLVVWTKHFTTFTTYTQAATPAPAPTPVASSGGGGGGGFMPVFTGTPQTQPAAVGQVLGAQTFNFARGLALGTQNADVTALQKLLESLGLFKIPSGVAYGYFGQLTRKAVMAFQAKNGLEQVGNVGPKTRAALNKLSQ